MTIYGNLYSFTYDDEDRLTKMVTPNATDTYTYNGLGLRVGKTDSTGNYSYVCDGTTPGSPVLIDGHTLYTPGLSENRGGTSIYYDFDRLGNLWTADGTGKSQYAAVDYSAFGITLAGSAGTPFGYGGANGCQTDLDASLVLMGHRYFDPRTGRFINQDPIGDGDNWYAYAGNNPVNDVDPSGLQDEGDPANQAAGPPADGTDAPSGWYTVPGSQWDDGHGHSGQSIRPTATSSTSPVTSSGGLLSAANMWYMGGMGGLSGFVDRNMMAGTASHFGNVTGNYDSGRASGGQVALAGSEAFGMALVNAVPTGKWAAGGFATLKITGGLLGSDLHFIYGMGGTSLHALHDVGTVYRIMEVSPSMMRLYRPLLSIRIPVLFPSAAMRVGGTAQDCLFAAMGAARRGLIGR